MKSFKKIVYAMNLIFVFITTILGTTFLIEALKVGLSFGYYKSLICYICSILVCNRLISIFKKLMQKEKKNE